MPLLTRKRWILAASEAANYGTDPSPAAAAAIQCSNMELTPLAGEVVPRTLIRSYLGANATLVATEQVQASIEVEMTGSGTAGTAPAFAPLLLSCGFAETTSTVAVTGTAQGGGANTITLASNASAVDGFYVGMPINFTGGTASGGSGVIITYDGATKIATFTPYEGAIITTSATTEYNIPPNVLYTPISEISGVADTSSTIYYFIDKVLHKMVGARGSLVVNAPLNQIPKLVFNLTSLYTTPVDQSTPAPIYSNQALPQIFRNGNAGAFQFIGVKSCLESLTFDLGNDVQYRALVGCTKEVIIVDRAASGNVVIEAPTMAEKNYFTAALDDNLGGSGPLSFLHGTAAGQKVALVAPNCDLGQPSYADSQGIHHLQLPYTAVPVNPGNNEVRLCFA
jgi:hypothetical protein